MLKNKFKYWLSSWKQDEEGDIAFVLFNKLAFVKYKEHTIIRFDGDKMRDAGKYQGKSE